MLTPVAQTTTPLPPQDWDALFHAVSVRLRNSAERSRESDAQTPGGEWLRTEVLDCVTALGQLHALVLEERDAQLRTTQELMRTEAALAWAHRELAATRAGERLAQYQARHDCLTRLPNRDGFRQRLNDELLQSRSRPLPEKPAPAAGLAVLYLDLDGLKPINDQHGHHAGDQLLRIVAVRLARAVRQEDMVCRMGGDEFACLLTHIKDREQLSFLACKLFDAVSAPLKIGALELTVRPSIGIAVCPDDAATADGLLQRADSAMYRAKRGQLGYAFFDAANAPRAAPRPASA